jgi:parvulin-like peptidyl-prolyl isomerase
LRKLISVILGSALLGGLALAGCARSGQPRPLDPEAFRLPRGGIAESPLGPVDQPPPPMFDAVRLDLLGPEMDPEPQDPEGIADIESSIHPPEPAPETDQQGNAIPARESGSPGQSNPNTRDTQQSTNGLSFPVRSSDGKYLTLGGVVAEVNGRPIYANDVLRRLRTLLMAEARKYDQEGFRIIAGDLIVQMVHDMIRDELLFAAAMRSLDARDRQLAERAAVGWRQEQITRAHGSVELARRRALAQGQELEEMVREQYRLFMVQLFRERKILPQVQVTVDQMRRYYDERHETEFTQHAQVRFRVIKVDPRFAGSRTAARDRIEDLHRAAVSGAIEFERLASMHNDDAFAKQNGGDVGGWIWRGNYSVPEVEQAVWETPVGQVTDIIDAGGSFYVAKVEEVQHGHVRPFDEREPPAGKRLTVQEEIYESLAMPQREALLAAIQDDWVNEAVVRESPEMLQTALDMAMQNYPRWAATAQALADSPAGRGE